MKKEFRYRGFHIRYEESATFEPREVEIDGVLCSMDIHYKNHGYCWAATASGRVYCYESESGGGLDIPRQKFIDAN